ncbi:glycerophosphodiester phosphodiesterase family protein [Streptomyces sp. 769]|uniref:glycerophosphodiester phosphodiesterase family protein n=1 Tax=Streptomyces sp. 769 TaxID=1262452 RepID=UPI000581D8EB|nr:glycerophosphodiester phosphodiesterase family protein [Streptomyces sp. 769]AJC60670.1 glycerophosphoryl diester phosphodiesterase family protein [Streptomyces sp. 769]
MIAHRAGTADFPENTVRAIDGALANKVDMMWLSVQVSRDGVPVLYRPADLSALTDGTGKVADHDAASLTRLNAGYQFKDASGGYPYRTHPTPLPTLEEALRRIPQHMGVLLDMKSADPQALVPAIAKTMDALEGQGRRQWQRVRFYSTEKPNLDAMASYPQARLFEDRDTTRTRLVTSRLTGDCLNAPRSGTWAAFELRRDVTVTEKFTLGEGRSPVKQALMWDRAASACFHTHSSVRTVLIGIETKDDYTAAKNLDAYAVLTDSPKRMMKIKNETATTPR